VAFRRAVKSAIARFFEPECPPCLGSSMLHEPAQASPGPRSECVGHPDRVHAHILFDGNGSWPPYVRGTVNRRPPAWP